MVKAPVSLTSLSEEQRAEAYARFELLRPTLEKGVSQAQVARTHQLSKSAVQRWVKRYREQGLAGLVTTALTTALTLRQAIWRKEDPRWSACGIPSVFYTDHGSDFTSKHLEQVAADIRMELVFSEKGVPRGRGKVERFFRSVDQLFLQDVPGYAPKGYTEAQVTPTLAAFEQRFRTWLLEGYHRRVHSETECQPKERWEKGGFVPRMPMAISCIPLLGRAIFIGKANNLSGDR